MSEPRLTLVLLGDLMFQVKIAEAAKKAGVSASFVNSPSPLLQRAAAEQPCLIMLDINFEAAKPLETIQALKADPRTSQIPLVGYVSHVQVELRAAASKAGCDLVIARSAFVQNLPEILAQHRDNRANAPS